MIVRVRLFAGLRERAGARELELELPEGARVSDALERVQWLAEDLPLVMAINRVYARPEAVLSSGDELALIPPVSGGAPAPRSSSPAHVLISDRPLSRDVVTNRVSDPRAGAVVTFEGVTRDVDALDYEAYAEMAQEQMLEIVTAAIARHGLCAAAAEHRVGRVALAEPSVIVAVSAAHRDEAFAGAREIIDEIKARAPIWKREIDGDTARWVSGKPPTS